MHNYSETLELSWNIEPNRTESNSIELVRSNFFNISMFFRVQIELIEIIQMHQIHHVKAFKCNKTEFGSIEPNS